MVDKLKIINVEDNPLDSELITHALKKGGLDFELTRVDTAEDFTKRMHEVTPDIVLADYSLPQFSGPQALNYIRTHYQLTPFIFVTGSLGEELAIETLKQGATDYIMKERLDRLAPAIKRALQEAEERKARREAQEALRQSEQLYRCLIENASDGIFTLTADAKLSSMNPSCARITGWMWELTMGKDFIVFLHPDDRDPALEWVQHTLAGENPPMVSLRVRKGDEYIVLEATSAPLQNAEQKNFGILAIARDVTERRQLEEQLRQAQKMESIGQLAGGVAHDFNNILTVIHGHAALLLGESGMPLKTFEALREIIRASDRAASLTRQLLTFSRKQPLQVREVDLNEVVSDITRMLQRILGEPITLRCEYTPRLPAVKVDPSMLEQVILNLVVNARDAMAKGGTLTLRTHRVTRNSMSSSSLTPIRDGEYVCLSAQDTGCGIPPELLDRIFEPFFTTKEPGKGTGLGLATVYGIVKQHGGWIDVQSTVNVGTCFTVYFPASSSPIIVPIKSKETPQSLTGGTECILLVEDELAVRSLCRRLLQKLGYTILEADSGNAALEVWKNHHAKVDLLLTDMVMPEGMTGHELASLLRRDNPDLPVILSTGYSPDSLSEGELHEQHIYFLAKPYTPNQLAECIRRCLKND